VTTEFFEVGATFIRVLFRSTLLSRPDKVGLKCLSVCPCVRTSVRPQKGFFDFNELVHNI